MNLAAETADYVKVRKGMTPDIKERAKAAVRKAVLMDGMGPRAVSRATGVPYSTIVYWVINAPAMKDDPDPDDMVEEYYAKDVGRIQIHSRRLCEGRPCVFHNPSDHHMRHLKRNIRYDRAYCLVERICPHGVGHPDPDSLAFVAAKTDSYASIHGCCGKRCCVKPK